LTNPNMVAVSKLFLLDRNDHKAMHFTSFYFYYVLATTGKSRIFFSWKLH
jgi:hypothetical protein